MEDPAHEVRSLSLLLQEDGSLQKLLQHWGRHTQTSGSYHEERVSTVQEGLQEAGVMLQAK